MFLAVNNLNYPCNDWNNHSLWVVHCRYQEHPAGIRGPRQHGGPCFCCNVVGSGLFYRVAFDPANPEVLLLHLKAEASRFRRICDVKKQKREPEIRELFLLSNIYHDLR